MRNMFLLWLFPLISFSFPLFLLFEFIELLSVHFYTFHCSIVASLQLILVDINFSWFHCWWFYLFLLLVFDSEVKHFLSNFFLIHSVLLWHSENAEIKISLHLKMTFVCLLEEYLYCIFACRVFFLLLVCAFHQVFIFIFSRWLPMLISSVIHLKVYFFPFLLDTCIELFLNLLILLWWLFVFVFFLVFILLASIPCR